ncbi:MAG TPA: tRNA (guanine(10)-N(2))-dimethyltransferase [Candidatus Methanoculleus thermohydrogenotrophicum]|jgi:tRNA (guanine26-N2/guanine27-N2)-dimethyltransferase|nr:tRNA (guanine(10)-N(2))-dimethyltransferase [Candidatus Methanoculleus thermohydrogenotrophicum]NLM82675.1 tRNA (guanine(10)-N(2))-dimethyltransferase [Candidatus Methanoculleus thermohydrogenotrophicum]HOB17713.1 tRNA (guanine(10)-N(2))-dimethyltransferase [Candidatus Methanoculleus thermohydrogenotrophicum]HPZ37930.1 tRNA (guanine(10)-N(2))-dimethyltransferase [Candidatus Methanoculleus thermohydrogenotrophicum]HQC91114.1 tRNA (guanine(10)-N(2))-dimethyltransferase [Candidatus Methanoculle
MDIVEVTEGKTRFFVPKQDPHLQFPPGNSPVFYNPRMELSRDTTVLLLLTLRPESYLDAMGASGVRGLRVAREVGIPVTINDRNPMAVDLIRRNVGTADLRTEVTREDANVLMSSRRFDAVDLDPFGTPAPFVDSAARSAGRYLFVTATDTAPLCGAHLKAGMRRYFSCPRNTEYHAEVGLRTLLGFVVREVIKYDRGVEPLFCYAHEHFHRLHLRLRDGAAAADRTLARIGYVMQCPHCLYRSEQVGMLPEPEECTLCGANLVPVGPLWTGRINDDRTLFEMQEALPDVTAGTGPRITRLLETCRQELDTSSHYDYHVIAKTQRVSPGSIGTVIERLSALGYRASRAHYSGTALKTDAPLPVLEDVISGG